MLRLDAGSSRNATTLELALLSILLMAFIYIAIQKIWQLRVDSERTAVEVMVGNLRAGLGVEIASLVVANRIPDIAELDGANPMLVTGSANPNYRGQLSDIDPAQIEGYSWYFDRNQGVLVYRVANEEYFETPLEGPARILFRLQLNYDDRNGNGRYDHGTDNLEGLELISLHPYRWRHGDEQEQGQQ